MLFIPQAQFRNDSILFYSRPEIVAKDSIKADKMRQVRKTQYSGTVTIGAQKRIRKAIDILIQTSLINTRKRCTQPLHKNLKLVFVTLTIPENSCSYNAQETHHTLLEPFLRSMRVKQKLSSYIWKVEQQKRGALHYHLTINCYISHLQVRKVWNQLLEKAGLMDSYKARYGNNNPNSTDVKAVYKCNNIAAYLAKYLSKTEQNENPIKGKVWDCSLNLKSAKRYTIEPSADFLSKVEDLIKKDKVKTVFADRFTLIFGLPQVVFSILSLQQFRDYDNWRFQISSYKRSVKIPKKVITIQPVVVSVQPSIVKQLCFGLKDSTARYLYN